jgi:hypothetical protein
MWFADAAKLFKPAVEEGRAVTIHVRSGETFTGEAVAFVPEASVVIIPEDEFPVVITVAAIEKAE